MATAPTKLAESLEILRTLQEEKGMAIKSSEMTRTHRERLSNNGFIQEVAKGWYVSTDPTKPTGDTTSWYTSYWQFCSRYLEDKYGEEYCISADQSILIHAGSFTVPKQLIIRAPEAPNLMIPLLHDTSFFEAKSQLPNKAETTVVNGIRMMTLPFALIHSSQLMYVKDSIEMRTALAQIKDSSEILAGLLDGSHTVIAGRLTGAFRNLGQDRIADEIIKTMKAADFQIREADPFERSTPKETLILERSPYANRVKLIWNDMRAIVQEHLPESPGHPENPTEYLKSVDEIYVTDAYHSLSIEHYAVSAELIEKVRSGDWDPDQNEKDSKQRDVMAARGYWQAAQAVKESISRILEGGNSGKTADNDHGDWYRELFAPSVASGILKASDLAGYRNGQVYISQSMHVPMNKDAVRDCMPVLFELLTAEPNPGVRAILGHFIFVYIHPYMDGNGRMGRFLMNVMLASGGFPWTVVPVEERNTYMSSLEEASVNGNIEPFAKFISHLVNESLKGTPVAKLKE